MKIEKKIEGSSLTISLEGRLDSNTCRELEPVLNSLAGIENIIFDFERLDYISSSGLKIILACRKKMDVQGNMIIKNANNDIRELFDITGFSNIIDIE